MLTRRVAANIALIVVLTGILLSLHPSSVWFFVFALPFTPILLLLLLDLYNQISSWADNRYFPFISGRRYQGLSLHDRDFRGQKLVGIVVTTGIEHATEKDYKTTLIDGDEYVSYRERKVILAVYPKFTRIDFSSCELRDSKFHDCTFVSVNFCNANLTNVTFDNCKFNNVKFDGSVQDSMSISGEISGTVTGIRNSTVVQKQFCYYPRYAEQPSEYDWSSWW